MSTKDNSRERLAIPRRDFLLGSAAVALGAAALQGCSDGGNGSASDASPGDAAREGKLDCASPQPLSPVAGAARVVEVHDPQSVSGKVYDATRVKAMLRAGLVSLARAADIKSAWKALLPDFSPTMRIGIKLNCLSSYLYSSPTLVAALVASLVQDLGASAERIVVWDRRGDELDRSRITAATVGAKVLGTVKSTSDASGPGYEKGAVCAIDKATRLSRLLTSETDVTINCSLLKTHGVSGLTGALKNIYGCIDNPGDFHDGLVTYLPALYRLDAVRTRLRLHITEAFQAVLKGDTASPPDNLPCRLLLSADPVALDTHAVALANKLRGALPPLPSTPLKWLEEAARLNLGTRSLDLQAITMP